MGARCAEAERRGRCPYAVSGLFTLPSQARVLRALDVDEASSADELLEVLHHVGFTPVPPAGVSVHETNLALIQNGRQGIFEGLVGGVRILPTDMYARAIVPPLVDWMKSWWLGRVCFWGLNS